MKKQKTKNKNIIAIIAIIISIIAIMNPHIENGNISKKDIIEIKGYQEFSSNSRMGTYTNMDVFSATFDCTKGIYLTNNFNELCNVVNKTYYCATKAIWEATGNGFCSVEYQKRTWFLKWF